VLLGCPSPLELSHYIDRERGEGHIDYRVKYGPLGWLMGQPMMKVMMGKIFDLYLKSRRCGERQFSGTRVQYPNQSANVGSGPLSEMANQLASRHTA